MAEPEVRVFKCPNGPLLVRGATTVTGPDGKELPVKRRVVALCRCETSAILPWCDGSHKVIGYQSPTT